eukprot:TRINITY_DN58213_c0_g1_i1.p1 TRINITY_DN58213_c0_g1~~TRINITY_DN58213_c0_g1_i1.p1  ORF type:complete len:668 (+),score=288.00 TRINITY_DN58213_c0_g1_i1:48-2051(+)
MAELDFKQRYIQACAKLGCEPLPGVTDIDSGDAKLLLSSQTLAAQGSLAVAEGLRSSTFTHIELCNCYVNDEGCRAICSALCGNEHLRSLNLSGNNFGGDSAEHLSQLLLHTPTLQVLGLEWNSLGAKPTAFARLCEALLSNKTLATLDLRNNRINQESVVTLARVLEGNTALAQVDLRWNRIGPRGGDLVAQAMAVNQNIVKLLLTGNDISYATLMGIDTRVQSNAKGRRDAEAAAVAHKKQVELQYVMKESVQRMQSEVDQRDMRIASEREKAATLFQENDTLVSELKRAKLSAEHYDEQVDQLQRDAAIAKESHEKNTEMLKAHYDETLSSIKADHMQRVEALQAEVDQAKAEADELRAVSKDLSEKVEVTEADAKRKGTAVEAVTRELEATSRSLAELKASHENLGFEAKRHEMQSQKLDGELEAKKSSMSIVSARKVELEERVLDLEREKNVLESQLQRIHLENERKVASVREELAAERTSEMEKLGKKVRDALDEVAARERVIEELRQASLRAAEHHQRSFDEAEAEHKKARDAAVEVELEKHRLSAQVAQVDAEKKRIQAELDTAEQRRDNIVKELELATRQHQSELDRMSERFASDRVDLERKLLQRDERLAHLSNEHQELSKRLSRMHDETASEKERLQRRITEQVRIIFDESAPYIP